MRRAVVYAITTLIVVLGLMVSAIVAYAQSTATGKLPATKGQQVAQPQPQIKNQSDPLEQNWLTQEQAYNTMKQHVNESVFKLMDERRVLLKTNSELQEILKNEREYWAAYVKGLK